MLTVTLTVEDDWESDPLRVVAGIREGMNTLDEWQRKAVATARQQGRSWEEIWQGMRSESAGSVGAIRRERLTASAHRLMATPAKKEIDVGEFS